jgi:hypothetical protein
MALAIDDMESKVPSDPKEVLTKAYFHKTLDSSLISIHL